MILIYYTLTFSLTSITTGNALLGLDNNYSHFFTYARICLLLLFLYFHKMLLAHIQIALDITPFNKVNKNDRHFLLNVTILLCTFWLMLTMILGTFYMWQKHFCWCWMNLRNTVAFIQITVLKLYSCLFHAQEPKPFQYFSILWQYWIMHIFFQEIYHELKDVVQTICAL